MEEERLPNTAIGVKLLVGCFRGLCFFSVLSLSFCSSKTVSSTNSQKSPLILSENRENFPTFNGKDAFLKAKGVQIQDFWLDQRNWSIRANLMFSCVGEHYFVKDGEYCLYFKELWIQAKISSEKDSDVFAIKAQAGYANKILNDFLFQNTALTMSNSQFILFSNIIHLEKDKNIFSSPPNSQHLMKDQSGNTLRGEGLVLDYRVHSLTMNNASLKLVENVS